MTVRDLRKKSLSSLAPVTLIGFQLNWYLTVIILGHRSLAVLSFLGWKNKETWQDTNRNLVCAWELQAFNLESINQSVIAHTASIGNL